MNRTHLGRRVALALALVSLSLGIAGCGLSIGTGVASTPSDGQSISVKVIQGDNGQTLIMVPVTIHGQGPYSFALDTGASITLVDSAIARKTGLKDTGESSNVSGIGGAQNVASIKISNWRAGNVSLPSATIARGDLPGGQRNSPLDGLLGSDVLSRFGRVSINYDSSTLTFYGTPTTAVPSTQFFSPLTALVPRRLTTATNL